MISLKSNTCLFLCVLVSIMIWGVDSVGTYIIVEHLPPTFSAMLYGFLLSAVMMILKFGRRTTIFPNALSGKVIWKAALSNAVFGSLLFRAYSLTTPPRVTLFLAAAPVWAVLVESMSGTSPFRKNWIGAFLALLAIGVLKINDLENGQWKGDAVAFVASFVWVWFGNNCKALGAKLDGMEITAHVFWRSSLLLIPMVIYEIWVLQIPLSYNITLLGWHLFSIFGAGVVALSLHFHALTYWQFSRVYIMENLLPLVSMLATWIVLDITVSKTFLPALLIMALAVTISQSKAKT
jgi:drug/metabolite transporter (DMT)-like permease